MSLYLIEDRFNLTATERYLHPLFHCIQLTRLKALRLLVPIELNTPELFGCDVT